MDVQEEAWSRDQAISFLQKVDLFRDLPEGDLQRVADIVSPVHLEAGEVLFEEGEAGDGFFIVFRGAVEILKEGPGPEPEKLAIRRSGDSFGEMALLNDAARSATARAREATHLMRVPREDFHELLGGDTLPVRLLERLSIALRALDMRLAASERLASSGSGRVSPDDVSRVVQRGLLPRNAPRVEGYDVAAGTTTEEGGTGDTVWDWVSLGDGRTALLAYDVLGEGLPPSHYLVAARTLIRALAVEHSDLRRLLARANSALSSSAVAGVDQFVECGVVVPGPEGIRWASAGKVPAGVIRRQGTFEELGSHGPPLGMMEGFRYADQEIPMGPGDVFVVLSQASMGLFRGAADLVAQVQGRTAGEVVTTLHRAIRRAHGDTPKETSVIFIRKH